MVINCGNIRLIVELLNPQKNFIGIDTKGNTSRDAAEGIDNVIKLFDSLGKKIKFSHQCIDASGGGTRVDLFLKIRRS